MPVSNTLDITVEQQQPLRPNRRRLLLVDDDQDTRDLMVRLLSRSFEMSVADGFQSALAAANEARPDLVLSDIGLGAENGIALMAELKRRYDVPGIAVSGHPLDPHELRAAGFVCHLLKPIRFDELLEALKGAATHVRPMSAATSL